MERENELKLKKICRFCLCQQSEKLDSIFEHGKLGSKATAPLPTQILAIASIEVFVDDGMPQWVCHDCRLLFEHSYRFKQMCKQAETLLKQYPLTGTWPQALVKPRVPLALISKQTSTATVKTTTPSVIKPKTPSHIEEKTNQPNNALSENELHTHPIPSQKVAVTSMCGRKTLPKDTNTTTTALKTNTNTSTSPIIKILNANPVASPEPPIPKRIKREKLNEDKAMIGKKIEFEEFMLADDMKDITAALENGDFIKTIFVSPTSPVDAVKKPRVLNKSSIRILNKEAEVSKEPRLREPKLKCDKNGNMAIVTEIMDPDEPYETEPDPIKTAVPVKTNVFPCPHCQRSFPLLQLRDIHLENHIRERSFPCSECGRSFFSKYDLQKHSLTHTGARPFKCKVCERSFTRATLLHRHEKTHTDMPKYLCVYCEKTFLSKDEMQKHTQRHLKSRPFQCKLCSKSFAFKQGLERHEVVHSRDQPHPCQYCKESFSTPSKLARHLTAHAGKRPYPCKFCPRSYLLSHHLSRHLRSHTQSAETMFHCFECKMEFKTREALITHSVTHGKETLSCPLCKETFPDVKTVDKHIRGHVEGEVHACEFCDMIFMLPNSLQEHIDTDHVEDMKAYSDNDKVQSHRIKNSVDDLQKTLDEFLVEDVSPNQVRILKDEIIKPVKPSKEFITKKITVSRGTTPKIIHINALKLQDVKTEKIDEKTTQEFIAPPPMKRIKLEPVAKKIITKAENITELRRNVAKAVVKQTQTKKNDKKISNEPVVKTSSQTVKNINTTQRSSVGNANKLSDEKAATRVLRVSSTQSKDTHAHKTDGQIDIEKLMAANDKILINQSDNSKIVKRITMTRAEAELMAKDGRIRIKDINMYLTKNSNNK